MQADMIGSSENSLASPLTTISILFINPVSEWILVTTRFLEVELQFDYVEFMLHISMLQ